MRGTPLGLFAIAPRLLPAAFPGQTGRGAMVGTVSDAGGAMSFSTKSGTTEFHRTAYEFGIEAGTTNQPRRVQLALKPN